MDWITILPPILAITVAMITRNVYWALGIGILLSETIIAKFNLLLGGLASADRAVAVFASPGNARVLIFCLLIGALIAYMRDSGGVSAVVAVLQRTGWVSSRKRAQWAPALTGSTIFIETNVSLFSAGILGRPLFDAYRISRARLAYIIDSTSAPVSVLVLLNGWGAYALGLLEPYGFDKPISVLAAAIPLNIYAIVTLVVVYFTAASDKVFGPMKHSESQRPEGGEASRQGNQSPGPEATRAIYMCLPLFTMVAAGLGFMWWTGEGDITAGSGSQSILWAICLALFVSYLSLLITRRFSVSELQDIGFAGIAEMLPPVCVLFLSIAFGSSLNVLGTGAYLSSIAEASLAPGTIPAVIFILAAVTAFMTGTSWGTYGIMLPIAMPLAISLGLPPSLMLAAVLGGGVAGDHCSPISDTTIIASLAAGCDHIEHVKTQLPYALVTGLFTVIVYLVLGYYLVGFAD